MDNQTVLRSNFLIVFADLQNAINNYLNGEHITGETKYIEAYLAAAIHALVDYADKYLHKKSDVIQACRYVNNTLKHNEFLVTHKKNYWWILVSYFFSPNHRKN